VAASAQSLFQRSTGGGSGIKSLDSTEQINGRVIPKWLVPAHASRNEGIVL
jgi:hypothetical protein